MASDFKLSDCMVSAGQPCWNCMKSCGRCAWSIKFEPIPGWIATRRVIPRDSKHREMETYSIKYCPEFEQEVRE